MDTSKTEKYSDRWAELERRALELGEAIHKRPWQIQIQAPNQGAEAKA